MTRSLDEAMRDFAPALPLAVAFSGGADSTALLLACARKWPGQVVAWHVNHGLQAAATSFEAHCHAVCAQWNVPLCVQTVDAKHASGQSPEDAARQARYKAFSALALENSAQAAIKSVAIAQHADDQVETILLALSRGAGLGGLSGMPAHWQREGLDFHRPLLSVSGADLRSWLVQHGHPFVEDPSNRDERFTRNAIRARLLPALARVAPHFRDTYARSAAHAAQAQALLDEVAQQDYMQVCEPGEPGPRIKRLQTLSAPRQANVLRYWFKSTFDAIPSAAQLAELLAQVAACTTRGHQIHIKLASGYVQRSGAVLTWYNP